jgi:hypothetical protein
MVTVVKLQCQIMIMLIRIMKINIFMINEHTMKETMLMMMNNRYYA